MGRKKVAVPRPRAVKGEQCMVGYVYILLWSWKTKNWCGIFYKVSIKYKEALNIFLVRFT